MILNRDEVDETERVEKCLSSKFKIKDLGPLKYFRGWRWLEQRIQLWSHEGNIDLAPLE